MSNISAWTTTAGGNDATPPDGWPKGMARAAVNDSARENMAAGARWYSDMDASLISGGLANVYTLTTNSNHAALSDQSVLVFRANVANTGVSTLNVDGLGAKTIKKYGGIDLESGDIVADDVVAVVYNATNDTYNMLSLPKFVPAASVTGAQVVELTAIRRFDADDTWDKTTAGGADLRYVEVYVYGPGAGGDNAAATGTSSFGAHCSATGGEGRASPGAGSSGDINLTGEVGERWGGSGNMANGGACAGPHGGPGGNGPQSGNPTVGQAPGGGGAATSGGSSGSGGGCAIKRIAAATLGATEDVVVGAGGTSGVDGAAGADGAVIVYEYGLAAV